jgi:hypothetical protein
MSTVRIAGLIFQNNGLQWLIDTAPQKEMWGVDRLVGEVMGIWYGSVHTLSIACTFALLDLYSRPQYVSELHAEVSQAQLGDYTNASKLPLSDSFLSESARLSAFESSKTFPKLSYVGCSETDQDKSGGTKTSTSSRHLSGRSSYRAG